MNILLIDVDSVIPNIALCKLAGYHKLIGNSVQFIRLGVSYYPYRRTKIKEVDAGEFDEVYASAVFEGTKDNVKILNKDTTDLTESFNIQLPENIKSGNYHLYFYGDVKDKTGSARIVCQRKLHIRR